MLFRSVSQSRYDPCKLPGFTNVALCNIGAFGGWLFSISPTTKAKLVNVFNPAAYGGPVAAGLAGAGANGVFTVVPVTETIYGLEVKGPSVLIERHEVWFPVSGGLLRAMRTLFGVLWLFLLFLALRLTVGRKNIVGGN